MQVGLETSRRFFSFEFFLGCLLFLYCWQVYTLWLHKKVRIKIFGIETAPLDSGWVFLVLPWESSNSYHNRHKCPINAGFLAAFSMWSLEKPPEWGSCPPERLLCLVSGRRCQSIRPEEEVPAVPRFQNWSKWVSLFNRHCHYWVPTVC